MPKKQADPLQGYKEVGADPLGGYTEVPRAQPVDANGVATIVPDIKTQSPEVYAGLSADHLLRVAAAQGVAIDAGQYFDLLKSNQEQANKYRQSLAEAAPGGLKEQEAAITSRAALTQKQIEQGPSATAEAIRRFALPGQPGGGKPGTISAPDERQKKEWPALIESFHYLKDLHTLFDNMAKNTAGAGGPVSSLGGWTTKITDLTSPEARIYHAFVESHLIPLAKAIMGDAATTAGKDNVQRAMEGSLPGNIDTLQTGGALLFNYYKGALDKLQTERDFAYKNGTDTSSIDTELLNMRSWFNSAEVQKYNPYTSSSLVQPGTSQQGQPVINSVRNAALAGTTPPPPPPGTPSTHGATGSWDVVSPSPEAIAAAQQQADIYKAQGQTAPTQIGPTPVPGSEQAQAVWDWLNKQAQQSGQTAQPHRELEAPSRPLIGL